MDEYLRIACLTPEVALARPGVNADRMAAQAARAAAQGAQLLVFPELALTGYTCGDLFFQQTLLQSALEALASLARQTSALECALAVGLPVELEGKVFNCAALVARGRVLGLVPKTYLPNHGEFYERRWFAPAESLGAKAVDAAALGLPGEEIPLGTDLIFDLGQAKVGMEICEDLWAPLPPSTFLALQGAEVVLNLSASNEVAGKAEYRRSLVTQQSARCICVYGFASAGAAESTTDLVFSGARLICENGKLLGQSQGISKEGMLLADCDLGRIRASRRTSSTFRDCCTRYGGEKPCRVVRGELGGDCDGALYPVEKLPFVPSSPERRAERCREIFQMQSAGLARRLECTGAKAVVGVSGGLDSTLALLVAAEAMQSLGRPASDVVGVTMPCFGTSRRTYENALALMEQLGINRQEINICRAVQEHFADIGHDGVSLDVTFENAQARERTQVLMDYAGRVGGFVVGTGDLSELALGWCTYNGDHMSMYGVNASVPKTLVRWMIDTMAQSPEFVASRQVLLDILDTPISPELLPPDGEDGIAQQTEHLVGPYELHDFFLYHMLRFGFGPGKIYRMACRAFRGEFPPHQIRKWMASFYRRFFSQQFKRSCMPDGVKVGTVSLSPRGDWRMPSDASGALWLEQIRQMEENGDV